MAGKKILIPVVSILAIAAVSAAIMFNGRDAWAKDKEQAKDRYYEITDEHFDLYYKNINGVEMTKEQYDNLNCLYDKDAIAAMSREMLDNLKDYHNLFSTFDYCYDKNNLDSFIETEMVDKEFKYSKDEYRVEVIKEVINDEIHLQLSRDDAIARAKEETTIWYNVVKAAYDRDNSMWRITFAEQEDSDEFQRVYIRMDGLTQCIMNVKLISDYQYSYLSAGPSEEYDNIKSIVRDVVSLYKFCMSLKSQLAGR